MDEARNELVVEDTCLFKIYGDDEMKGDENMARGLPARESFVGHVRGKLRLPHRLRLGQSQNEVQAPGGGLLLCCLVQHESSRLAPSIVHSQGRATPVNDLLPADGCRIMTYNHLHLTPFAYAKLLRSVSGCLSIKKGHEEKGLSL